MTKKFFQNLKYIYIVRETKFIQSNEKIYKLGKTSFDDDGTLKSIKLYPEGSHFLGHWRTWDDDYDEKKISEIFQKKFITRQDIGKNYFEGNPRHMTGFLDIYFNMYWRNRIE